MKALKTLATVSALFAVMALPAAADNSRHNRDREYEVTITNASATAFTPILAVAHKAGLELVEVGAPPSHALAEIAESGSRAGLIADLALVPDEVGDIQESAGLLMLGDEPAVIELVAGRRFDRLSIIAMLLPTNDSIVALLDVALPGKRGRSVTYHAIGYDAGSEFNDELCVHIPGPPPCFGEAQSDPADSDEGYVRVSPGIQGVGDLSRTAYDWRNPVAIVTITRVR
jgi:hypothetical protein